MAGSTSFARRHLFDAALFEPGHHLPLKAQGAEPVDVPTSAPELLGTAHHLLINELCRSPDTLLGSITRLMKQVRLSATRRL